MAKAKTVKYDVAQLQVEISQRRPWYQRIDFEAFGVSTTDDPENAMLDAAWDNKIGDITLEQAAQFRPQPKWAEIQKFLPPVADREVLEIGSNCGFFSLVFAAQGAKRVVGLDVSPHWLDNARWAAGVKKLNNVDFINVDFMNYSAGEKEDPEGLLSDNHASIPLPSKKFDMVFMSTVIDHLFFPLFSIYKMMRIARDYVIIDCPCIDVEVFDNRGAMTLSVADDGSHHGFVSTAKFWQTYMLRLGVGVDDIKLNFYNEGRNVCMVVDVRNRRDALIGA
jgi:2-polyprenyl-3-methyl-5-hydroxy-6-metoxy-1,4-benzoquinol methylase